MRRTETITYTVPNGAGKTELNGKLSMSMVIFIAVPANPEVVEPSTELLQFDKILSFLHDCHLTKDLLTATTDHEHTHIPADPLYT